MLLDELASELVNLTASLVHDRTINIMNTDGIIIASSDPLRVGSYHHGAREAVLTNKIVNIYRDQLNLYQGAKEGCNMPIRVNGTIIGVIGIYGDPDEIRDLAHLLDVYASKYYQLEATLRPVNSEHAMRSALLAALLTSTGNDTRTAEELMRRLQIRLTYPLRVIVIAGKEPLTLASREEELFLRLKTCGFPQAASDIWGVLNGRMVLIASALPGRSPERLRDLKEDGLRFSLGLPCVTLWDVRGSYDQASLLDRCEVGAWQDIEDVDTRCRYLLDRSEVESEDLLDRLTASLRRKVPADEIPVLLNSARAYYECGRSVSRAAEKCFIHKNTLQYRVRRLLSALEIESLPPFRQEFLVRLLLLRFLMNSGPDGLE